MRIQVADRARSLLTFRGTDVNGELADVGRCDVMTAAVRPAYRCFAFPDRFLALMRSHCRPT